MKKGSLLFVAALCATLTMAQNGAKPVATTTAKKQTAHTARTTKVGHAGVRAHGASKTTTTHTEVSKEN